MRGLQWPIVGAGLFLVAEVALDVVGALTVPIVRSAVVDYVADSAASAGGCNSEGASAPSLTGEIE